MRLKYKRQKQNELAAMAKFAKMCADSVAPLNNFWSRRTATYAADSAASAAASAATYAAGYAAASAFADQKAKNKQFLITCITECE